MTNEFGVELDRNGYAPSIAIHAEVATCAGGGTGPYKDTKSFMGRSANGRRLWVVGCGSAMFATTDFTSMTHNSNYTQNS